MDKVKELLNKYKGLIVTFVITLGIVLQLAGGYAGYQVYDKFNEIQKKERIIRNNINKIKKTQRRIERSQDHIVDMFGKVISILKGHQRTIDEVKRKLKR